MSLRHKVLGNSIYQLVGKALTTITSLVLVAVITRSLGVAGYGNYVTVLAYTQFFGIFADLGVNLYLVKRLSAHPEGDEEAQAMFSLRLITTTVILVIGALGAFFTPYPPELRLAIALGMVAVAAQTLNSLGVSVLQARLHMLPSVVSEVVGRLAVLTFSVWAILSGAGLYAVIGAVVLGAVVNLFITLWASHRYLPITISWQPIVWKRILWASLPISLTAILSYIYFRSDTVLLSLLPLAGGRINQVEVGIYGAAYKVLDMLLLIPAIFIGNIFPIISAFWESRDARLQELLQEAFDLMTTFGAGITVVVGILATPIMLFVAGSDFAAAATPLRILAFTIFLSYFSSIYTFTALALNEQRRLAIIYTMAVVFNLIANIIFIPQYSYTAAAIVTFLTEMIVLIGAFVICKQVLKIHLHLRKTILTIPVVLLTGGFLWYVRSWPVLLSVGLGLAFYALLAIIFRLVDVKQLARLINRSKAVEAS